MFTSTGVCVQIATQLTHHFHRKTECWSSQILCRRLICGTGYCEHESSLCATICWGSASVPGFVRSVQEKKQIFSFITEPSSPPLSWNYPLFMSRPKNWCVWLATADRRPLRMPCVQNIKLVPVPGIDLLSEKEHPGSFGRHYLLHTTTNLI